MARNDGSHSIEARDGAVHVEDVHDHGPDVKVTGCVHGCAVPGHAFSS